MALPAIVTARGEGGCGHVLEPGGSRSRLPLGRGVYSYLNATVGSIVVARRAGTSAANSTTIVNRRLMAT